VKLDGFEAVTPGSTTPAAGAAPRPTPTCTMTSFTGGGFGFPGGGRGGRGRGASAPPETPMSSVRKDQVAHCEPTVKVPANARVSEPYWHRKGEDGRYTFDDDAPFGLPLPPTRFYVQVTLGIGGGEEVIVGAPVEHRYEGNIFSGEKRSELLVVPAVSVRVTPQISIVPAASIRPVSPLVARRGSGAPSPDREVRVTVVNDTDGVLEPAVRLEVPAGWTVTPKDQKVKLERADESQTVRFMVKPAATAKEGEFQINAVATVNGQNFNRGYEIIEYPHIQRYHIYDDARTTLKVIDVRVQPNLTVGYVMGTGDQVPPAIEQLGAKVEMISADDLAFGNLSHFDVIVTGIRAYERRDDLRANNSRLLEYVFNGGTVVVQYNKFEFNDAQYGPFPAKVSSNRITDEAAPPRMLDAHNPVFTSPNEINEAAWKNWVQERGLYFLGEKDSRYHDLVQFEDNFTYNRGPKNGALVEASYGKGRWLYVGLGLWRQLPAGTDGAYQILANLISMGKTPVKPATR
jgi:hypothetical protein